MKPALKLLPELSSSEISLESVTVMLVGHLKRFQKLMCVLATK